VAAIVKVAREAGASESDARRLERDLNMLAQISGLYLPYQIAAMSGAGLAARAAPRLAGRRTGDVAEVAARTGRSASPALFRRWARDAIQSKRPAGQSAKVPKSEISGICLGRNSSIEVMLQKSVI
jgi:hypothetical protein